MGVTVAAFGWCASVAGMMSAANWCRLDVSLACAGLWVTSCEGARKVAGSKATPGGSPRRGSCCVSGKVRLVMVLLMTCLETIMFMPSAEMVGHPMMVFTVMSLLRANDMTQGLLPGPKYGVWYHTMAESSPSTSLSP